MATFGTPRAGDRDAASAVDCAHAMAAAIAAWNGERAARGLPPVEIGIGLHYGPAVLGDIGGEGWLEYTVIGDTVNVASRLEGATRALGAEIVVSDALSRRARAEGGDAVLDGFVAGEPQTLRNRAAPLDIWIRPRQSPA